MATTLVKYLLSLLLLMPVAGLQAQPSAGESEASEQQAVSDADTGNSTSDEQSDAGNSDTDLPDIDSQPIDSADSQGPGRFIPSEQISQDFGVSFPVDI
ncbi:hypothetical protein [Pseudohongiella sp.]|uniref:Uncharacterized protein n=1 Tax=marine sediment metagenome TaxID=412755 RepID=A0A0F9W9K0_9ZZZZ|nr:hypothetical protein [Pseudohongiella sp.]HDZ08035.1 hypothetical protein [Pseudohongiella sp.]HEA64122.1 hypothetical protein [Pseudohongiella sp.]